jgi:integrase
MVLLLSNAFVPPSLAGPILVDDLGMPRYWALTWAVIDGASIKPSYLRRQLAAIELLYRATEKRTGSDCLDQILTRADLKTLQPVLEGLFIELTNRSVSMGFASNENWNFAFRFVQRVLERGAESKIGQLHRFQAKLDHLTKLYGQLDQIQPFVQGNLRALPAAVVQDLYELVDPLSTRNPFRSEDNRYRNYAFFLLLLHMGLRRSEGCGLLADSIKSSPDYSTGDVRSWIDIARRPKGIIDTRSSPAELKTPQSKRQLPIANELVAVIDHYADNYRGKPEHPFLFSSQKGSPLSLPMVNSIFETLSEHLSDAAKRELRDRRDKTGVSPHHLRHTAAVFRLAEFLEAGETMEVALGKLRAFFGWSKCSNMPSHYAGAYFEQRLATVWNSHFDAHVERLRQLEN